jgi:hypothetical protein
MKVPITAKSARNATRGGETRETGDALHGDLRSRPAFQIVPIDDVVGSSIPLRDDPLFRAGPVGHSRDGRTAADHDAVLYGR